MKTIRENGLPMLSGTLDDFIKRNFTSKPREFDRSYLNPSWRCGECGKVHPREMLVCEQFQNVNHRA